MGNANIVEAWFVDLLVASGFLCAGAFLYIWSPAPMYFWLLGLAGLGVSFVVIPSVQAVTIWPLVLLIAKVFGRSRRLASGGWGDDVPSVLWVGVGVGCLATAFLPFALSGILIRSPVALLWPVTAAAALALITVRGLRAVQPGRKSTRFLVMVIALALGAALVPINLLPATARDELIYHLAAPAWYARVGRMVDIPFSKYSCYPLLLQLLYLPLVVVDCPQLAKFLHCAFGIATASVLLLHLKQRVSYLLALVCALLFLTTPTVFILMGSAQVDLGLAFFSALAVVGLLRWSESGGDGVLALTGLAAGFAGSTKYNGLLALPLLACAVVLVDSNRAPRAALRSLGIFPFCSLLPMLPWFARNYLQTGNPLFPLFNGFLGGRPIAPIPAAAGSPILVRRMLYGESWLEIALVPLRVFVTGQYGDLTRFDGVFNPIYLLGAVATVWWAPPRSRAALGLAVVFFVAVLFLDRYESRYLLPGLVPLVILTTEALARFQESSSSRRLVALLLFGAFLFNGIHLVRFWTTLAPISYLSGRVSHAQFISRFVPEYGVTQYASRHLPPDKTVYLVFLGSRGFYWNRPYFYDDNYLAPAIASAVHEARNPAEVGVRLAALGISYLAANDALLDRYVGDNFTREESERWSAFKRDWLVLLHSEMGVTLYELRGPGPAPRQE